MAKQVLVTGADGFIGSHLAELLLDKGYDVRALVQYNSFGTWGWLDTISDRKKQAIDVVMGDIRDVHGMMNVARGCDIIFHLAALIAIPYSYSAPGSYIDTNVNGTLNLLEAARKTGARMLHTSTSEVYGTAQYVPIDEKHPLNAQSPYAASKIAADQLALSYHASFGLSVTVVRPFNTYGPRQSARAVIPTIITQLAAEEPKLKLGALQPTRDFNYVEDTCRGFEAIAKCEASMTDGKVINLGSDYEISILDTARTIANLMNVELNIEADNKRIRPENSEVERLWSSNKLALELLDWHPENGGIKGFEKGLAKTIDWFSQPENLALYKTNFYNV